MKILSMNFVFELPEDFDGTINDALLELVKYRINHGDKDISLPDLSTEAPPVSEKLWKDFLAVQEAGYKFRGHCGISQLKDGAWENVEKRDIKNE